MNSRSRKAQDNKEKYPTLRNARDFLTGLLFLSVIWALFSRIMTKLGIIPSNSILGSGTSTKEMATRLSGRAPTTPEILRKAPEKNAQGKVTPQENPSEKIPPTDMAENEDAHQKPAMRNI
tara:strand:- start:733 stop:1095 length:363 start_codon:yes stop_codon:yes gene_type:complete